MKGANRSTLRTHPHPPSTPQNDKLQKAPHTANKKSETKIKDWYSSGYPARHLEPSGQRWDWLTRGQLTTTEWDTKFDLQFLLQSGSRCKALSRQICPWEWDSLHMLLYLRKRPTQSQTAVCAATLRQKSRTKWLSHPQSVPAPTVQCRVPGRVSTLLTKVLIIIIIITTLKGAYSDFLQSPH